MSRVRYRHRKRRRPADWPTPEQELAEGVPLDRYTSALARWQAKAPHWFVHGFHGKPWPGEEEPKPWRTYPVEPYTREDAIRDLEQAHEWEELSRHE